MDVSKTLRELYDEKRRLDTAIAALEDHLRSLSGTAVPIRRGRKKMSPEERLAVSRRMSKYWEERRAQAQASEAQPAPPADDSNTANAG